MSKNNCNIWFGFDATYSFVITEKQGSASNVLLSMYFNYMRIVNYANYMIIKHDFQYLSMPKHSTHEADIKYQKI